MGSGEPEEAYRLKQYGSYVTGSHKHALLYGQMPGADRLKMSRSDFSKDAVSVG